MAWYDPRTWGKPKPEPTYNVRIPSRSEREQGLRYVDDTLVTKEGVVGMDKLKEMEKKNKHKFPDWFQWEWDSDSEQLHLFLSESTLIVDKVQYLKKWGKK